MTTYQIHYNNCYYYCYGTTYKVSFFYALYLEYTHKKVNIIKWKDTFVETQYYAGSRPNRPISTSMIGYRFSTEHSERDAWLAANSFYTDLLKWDGTVYIILYYLLYYYDGI